MTVYFGLCFYQRVMLSEVFGRPSRTISRCKCCIQCVLLDCVLSVSVCLSALLANKRVQ